MRKESLVLYNRIRNLQILYKYLINRRNYAFLAALYKIGIPAIDRIIRKQTVEYNFYIIANNKLLDYNVQTISRGEVLGMDEEYRLFRYIHERISAVRSLVVIKEESIK